jgi:hypothetical protein
MDLAAVMDEIGDRLDTIPNLRVFRHPPGKVTPPAAIVSFPDGYTFDATYGRGSDEMKIPLIVVVGKPTDKPARDRLAEYVNGSGARSFKSVLEAEPESGGYTAFDVVRVEGWEFDVVTIGGTDYMAGLATLDIAGPGSE